MSNKNEVFEYLIDQLRQQVGSNPYKQQCEDLAHEALSLKNQLRDASAQIKELHLALVKATGDAEAYKLIRKGEHGAEQSCCRKGDTQGCCHEFVHSKHKSGLVCFKCGARKECEHEWRVVQYSAGVETNKCRLCGEEKEVRYEQSGCGKEYTQECYHNWRFVNGKAPAVCVNCGVTKSGECEHEWQFYGVGFPCMCIKCGLKK